LLLFDMNIIRYYLSDAPRRRFGQAYPGWG